MKPLEAFLPGEDISTHRMNRPRGQFGEKTLNQYSLTIYWLSKKNLVTLERNKEGKYVLQYNKYSPVWINLSVQQAKKKPFFKEKKYSMATKF